MDTTRIYRSCLAELIGAFALTFIGAGAILTNQSLGSSGFGVMGIALAHGLVLSVFVSGLGHVSGAHFNPAITFGFMITRRMDALMGLLYIVAQLIGASIAAGLLVAIFPAELWQTKEAALGAPQLGSAIHSGTGVLIEAILTFFLVFTVFATAADPRGPKSIAGFGIGLVLVFDILVGGPLTGAAMNPARAFGPTLAAGPSLPDLWDTHWVYWAGPLLGGGIAALLYNYVFWRSNEDGGLKASQSETRARRPRRRA
jgi:aquaporin Z